MSRESSRRIKPLDSFARVHMWLMLSGYIKLRNPRNKYTNACYKLYRKISLVIVLWNASNHIIHTVQMALLGDNEKLVESILLTIPMLLLVIKAYNLYFRTNRYDKLIDLMEDPIFGADSEQAKKILSENADTMIRISDIGTVLTSGAAFFWIVGPIIKRYQDPNTIVATYMPFHTNSWPRFLLANFLDTLCLLPWVAFSNVSIEVTIATLYAQAHVQLKIINYNLEHLFDNVRTMRRNPNRYEFVDVLDENLQDRFVKCVERFDRVCWFTDEVTSIFNLPVSVQFIVIAVSSCLAIFQMSSKDLLSVTFLFNVGYYIVTQSQIFIYCYYGGLVQHESSKTADAVYLGEWVAVSPRFRRQLLIAMARWMRPITPTVSGIVPLSLPTYLSMSRSAYTLFTVLKSKNNKESDARSLSY